MSRRCPKCGGNMFPSPEHSISCLQCGFEIEIPVKKRTFTPAELKAMRKGELKQRNLKIVDLKKKGWGSASIARLFSLKTCSVNDIIYKMSRA